MTDPSAGDRGGATVEPFVSRTDPAELDDLRARLRATRWPDAPEDVGWSMGVDLDTLRDLVAYWADGFDWPAQEAALNRLPRFRVRLSDGLGVHVVHARAAERSPAPVPLLLCHGWPDSFWRYLDVIGPLTDPGAHGGDPADAFDVVVPDMPGFGYSDTPPGEVLDSRAVAGLWAELMSVLGYERFAVAGGDVGSGVARFLALDHPERVVAVHRMDAGLPRVGDPATLSAEEQAWLQRTAAWAAAEGAYAAVHRTKPQTAGVGLTDSPAGLAAWIVEKLASWSDGDDVEQVYGRDAILTNVTIYWLTRTITSSMRMYRANAAISAEQQARRVEVPSGFALFPGDILTPPQAWLERATNLVHVTRPPRGGHFAPVEQPGLYVEDLRTFVRPFRPDTR